MKTKSDNPTPSEPSKTKICLRMDGDVRAYFKAQDDYEQKINKILRDYVEEQKRNNESRV